jgi:predicted alpha/beta-fold hydrolase
MEQNPGSGLERASRTDRFEPPIVLRHPHTQSILPNWPPQVLRVRRQAAPLLNAALARLVDCGAGVRLLGFHSAHPAGSKGLVVMLHGWEGSAESSYILSSGTALFAAGFDVFRLNFRDHGGTQALNRGLFNSCLIDEVVAAVRAVQRDLGPEPCFIVGFSLGGNFALRVARRADAAGLELRRVVAVCPVLAPRSTMRALESGFFVYRTYFLARWRQSLRAKAASFPDLYDFQDLRRHPTLTATTAYCVREYSEFPDLDAYLDGYAITGAVLEDLSIPSRIIVAEDDPIIPVADVEQLASPDSLKITRVRHGGHCGFVADYRLNRWLDQRLLAELLAAL